MGAKRKGYQCGAKRRCDVGPCPKAMQRHEGGRVWGRGPEASLPGREAMGRGGGQASLLDKEATARGVASP